MRVVFPTIMQHIVGSQWAFAERVQVNSRICNSQLWEGSGIENRKWQNRGEREKKGCMKACLRKLTLTPRPEGWGQGSRAQTGGVSILEEGTVWVKALEGSESLTYFQGKTAVSEGESEIRWKIVRHKADEVGRMDFLPSAMRIHWRALSGELCNLICIFFFNLAVVW